MVYDEDIVQPQRIPQGLIGLYNSDPFTVSLSTLYLSGRFECPRLQYNFERLKGPHKVFISF